MLDLQGFGITWIVKEVSAITVAASRVFAVVGAVRQAFVCRVLLDTSTALLSSVNSGTVFRLRWVSSVPVLSSPEFGSVLLLEIQRGDHRKKWWRPHPHKVNIRQDYFLLCFRLSGFDFQR